VSDYIPEFALHGKERITLRHVLAHRAGLPNLPPEAFDLDLLGEPDRILEIPCDAEHAFGHVGLSNVFCWADPERKLSVALLNTGKPIAARHVIPMFRFILGLGSTFSKVEDLG